MGQLELSPNFRHIVVDIRGHGRSDKPECCYARIDFAYDIKLLLDTLKILKADIVGHSSGSLITQVLAEESPERVLGDQRVLEPFLIDGVAHSGGVT